MILYFNFRDSIILRDGHSRLLSFSESSVLLLKTQLNYWDLGQKWVCPKFFGELFGSFQTDVDLNIQYTHQHCRLAFDLHLKYQLITSSWMLSLLWVWKNFEKPFEKSMTENVLIYSCLKSLWLLWCWIIYLAISHRSFHISILAVSLCNPNTFIMIFETPLNGISPL